MKSAITIADAASLTPRDVFDLEDAYVRSVQAKPRNNRSGVFHPSAVGGCKRRSVYEYINTPVQKAHEVEDQEVFDIGHAIHDLVETKIEEMDNVLGPAGIQYEFQREVPFDPATDQLFTDFGIGGTCDGVLDIWAVDGSWRQRGVLEIKSIKADNYARLKGPKKDHLMQAHLYAYRFDCPIMWLWYYNKDTSKRRVFVKLFQRDILMEALKIFEECLLHAEAGTLPEREQSYWACPRCEYNYVCEPPILHKIRNKSTGKRLAGLRNHGKLRQP